MLAWVDTEGEEKQGGGDGEGGHAGDHLLPLLPPPSHVTWGAHPSSAQPPLLPTTPLFTIFTQHSPTSSHLKTLHYWTAH